MRVIGLTGGIASGKSTITAVASQKGAHIINADLLGHKVYTPGTLGFKSLVEKFGEGIIAKDGAINRKALGNKVFGNEDSLKDLADIVWPEIRSLAKIEIQNVRANHPNQLIILEAAVLIEAEWQNLVDELWVVSVDPSITVERAMKRDGANRNTIETLIDHQMSNAEREKYADVVLDNSGSEAQLIKAVSQELDRILASDRN